MCPFAEFCKPAIFLLALAALASAQDLPENAQRQIRALLSEKDSRNSAQVKMDSHLVHAAQILRGRPVSPDFPTPPGELESVHLDANSFVEVDIQADVTPALLALIRSVGGAVVSAFPEYESVRARLPLVSVERVAGLGEVRQIRTAAQAFVNTEGPDVVGDTAHQAITARPNFGLDGAGVKIGVISNGVNSLAAEQTALRLPAVNVIAGPAGSGDEGTAMLEIVYTLAPGATLYFATGNGGEAQMAANIQALATAGCSIIVDDLMYFAEGAFQDDTVSKAVDTVTAAGVFYFSAAGNNNSLKKSTSGTWQGDFLDSGTTLSTISAKESGSYAIHSFGAANYDTLTIPSTVSVNGGEGVYELMWSDPLGQSANDYDLFITDSSGNVLGSSTNVQNGREDPEEDITGNSTVSSKCASGTCHIIIVKHGGAATFARALFLSTERGELSIATSGATYGHSAAASAVTVAATNATYGDTAGCTGFATSCNGVLLGVESYSSDGPRQMFYNENGTAITPNNFLIGTGGGLSLSKPDITAADNINTGVSGFALHRDLRRRAARRGHRRAAARSRPDADLRRHAGRAGGERGRYRRRPRAQHQRRRRHRHGAGRDRRGVRIFGGRCAVGCRCRRRRRPLHSGRRQLSLDGLRAALLDFRRNVRQRPGHGFPHRLRQFRRHPVGHVFLDRGNVDAGLGFRYARIAAGNFANHLLRRPERRDHRSSSVRRHRHGDLRPGGGLLFGHEFGLHRFREYGDGGCRRRLLDCGEPGGQRHLRLRAGGDSELHRHSLWLPGG